MAAVQPLKYTGGAYGALDGAADDSRFNSLGVGKAANGTRGTLDFGTAARSAVIQLNDSTGALDFTSALLYTFNNALRGPDGTLAAPAFAFTNEANTGLRRVAAGDVRIVAAGADVAAFLSTGRMLLGIADLTTLRGGSLSGRTDGSSLTITGGAAGTLQGLVFDTSANHTATSGVQEACRWGYTFAPTSGTAEFYGLNAAVVINQTGGASGDYTGLRVAVTETAAGGTNKRLINLLVGGASKFAVASSGLVTVAGRVTGVAVPTGVSDAVRADEAGPSCIAGFIGTIFDTTVRYSGPFMGSNVDTTEDAVSYVVPHACALRALRVRTNDPPAGDSVVFEVMIDGVANATLKVTYATTDTGTVPATDLTTAVAVSAGARISLRFTPGVSYTSSSMTNVRWSLDATRL